MAPAKSSEKENVKFGEAKYRPGSLKKVVICVKGCPELEEDDSGDWVVGEGWKAVTSAASADGEARPVSSD